MNVVAITRFRQGDLHQALAKLGWSQAELARRADMTVTAVNGAVTMRRRPGKREAEAMQKAFGDAGVYLDILELWPENFKGFKQSVKLEQTRDIPVERLVCGAQVRALPAYAGAESSDAAEALEKALGGLTERERQVLEACYFEDGDKSIAELAASFGVCRGRLHQIREKALRKLRHPLRFGLVEDAYEVVVGNRKGAAPVLENRGIRERFKKQKERGCGTL